MGKRKLTNEEIGNICRETALLIHSAVLAADAFSLLAEEEKDPDVKLFLNALVSGMDDGLRLYEAAKKTEQLPAYMCHLLEVGETSGRMEETLNALADYYDDRVRMERRIKSSVTYPAMLTLIMLIVIVVLLTKVLPVFEQTYRDLGSSLTGVAGGMLKLGKALNMIMPVLLVLVAAAVLGLAAFSVSEKFREFLGSKYKIWFGDRGVSRKINEARFASALAMGYSSGLPVENAVSLAASLLEDVPQAKKRCEQCLNKLDEGMELSKALYETGVIPAAECRILSLGIKSGSGDQTMENIAERLSESAEAELGELIGRIEPALVICSSLMVGIILLSVMLPLMNIMTAIG